MGKKDRAPKVNKKYIREAAEVRVERRKWLLVFLFSLVVGIGGWILITFTPINDHTMLGSIIIFGIALVVVVVIGELGVKFSRYNTEYNKIKKERGVTNEMVKDYMSKHM